MLGDKAFFGRGSKGPLLILVDDCKAEHLAIQSVWEDSTILLCTFHYLQVININ